MEVDEGMKKLSVQDGCTTQASVQVDGITSASVDGSVEEPVNDSTQGGEDLPSTDSLSPASRKEGREVSSTYLDEVDAGVNPASTRQLAESSEVGKHRRIMLENLSHTEAHFKHQQRGEPDLTLGEKFSIAAELLEAKPTVFLSRYGKYLNAEDLVCFEHLKDDYIINFHLQEIKKRLDDRKNTVKIRNRRYEAMKQLMSAGQYFSDEEMKFRDPLLYEQMVGQFLTDDDIHKTVDKSDLRFSSILLCHMDILENNAVYHIQKDMEEKESSGMEVDEDPETEEDESDLDDDENPANTIAAGEKLMLRDEFINTMKERFLAGQDETFDYTTVDGNVEYDSLDQREHDEQEKYFDDDDDDGDYFQVDDDDAAPVSMPSASCAMNPMQKSAESDASQPVDCQSSPGQTDQALIEDQIT